VHSVTGYRTDNRHCGEWTAGFNPAWFDVSQRTARDFAGSSAVLEQSHGNTNHASEYDFSTTSKQGFGKLVRSHGSVGDCDCRVEIRCVFGGP